MRFAIKLESNDASFVDEPIATLDLVLGAVRGRVHAGYLSGVCLELNGNRIGAWELDGTD